MADSKNLTVRVDSKSMGLLNKIVIKALEEELFVEGKKSAVQARQGRIISLAIDLGLPLVHEKLREIQSELFEYD